MTEPDAGPIGGEGKIVESDETFERRQDEERHRASEPAKHAVHALVERGGNMQAKHVADVDRRDARQEPPQAGDRMSELHTDEALAYHWMGGRESARTAPSIVPLANTSVVRTGPGVQGAGASSQSCACTARITASASSTSEGISTNSCSVGTTARASASKISSAPPHRGRARRQAAYLSTA